MPAYNEKENVSVLIPLISFLLRDENLEIVVVDDGSPDGTAERVRELSGSFPVRLVERGGKRGLSSAIIDGIRASRGEIIAVMDCDLQHPAERLPDLIREVREGASLAIGSRYVEGGGTEGWSVFRKVISLGAVALARALVPKVRGVSDPVSGFFAFRRGEVAVERLSPRSAKILLDILVNVDSGRVREVPYIFRGRKRGRSKFSLRDVTSYVAQVLRLATGS